MSGFQWDKITFFFFFPAPSSASFLFWSFIFFFYRKKGRQNSGKEGTKAKVCFGINEMDELPFQMAKQCLHSSKKSLSME